MATCQRTQTLYALMLPGKGRDLEEESGQEKEKTGVGTADNILIVQDRELVSEVEGGEERMVIPKRRIKMHQQRMGRITWREKLLCPKHTGQT